MNGQSAGKSFAYILGVYLGDGCVTHQTNRLTKVFKMNTIDYDFATTVQNNISELGYKCSINKYFNIKYTQGFIYHLGAYSCKDLCNQLVEDTKSKTIIPKYVFEWNIELKKHFIAGLMDSDGFMSHNRNRNSYIMGYKKTSAWVPDFYRLITSIGILCSGIRKDYYNKNDKTKFAWLFNIKIKSWIKNNMFFNISRKNDRVDMYAKTILNDYTLETPT